MQTVLHPSLFGSRLKSSGETGGAALAIPSRLVLLAVRGDSIRRVRWQSPPASGQPPRLLVAVGHTHRGSLTALRKHLASVWPFALGLKQPPVATAERYFTVAHPLRTLRTHTVQSTKPVASVTENMAEREQS